jgi:hypothetical protein
MGTLPSANNTNNNLANSGGNNPSNVNAYNGGGGGGASTSGSSPTASASGNGGDGYQSSITGTIVRYGGGGGGGGNQNSTINGGNGGLGGGGGGGGYLGGTGTAIGGTNGSSSSTLVYGGNGGVNTGSGGGGSGGGPGGSGSTQRGGDGGSGIVIIAFSTKTFYEQIIPLYNDNFNSNTTTTKGALNYVCSASSIYAQGDDPFKAFDGNASTFWHGASQYSNGIYIGGYTTVVSSQSISGEWLQMKLPSPIILQSFVIQTRGGFYNRNPKVFIVAGSNDGSTWSNITTVSLTVNPNTSSSNSVSNTISYSYYRLIIQEIFGGTVVNLSQFNLFA